MLKKSTMKKNNGSEKYLSFVKNMGSKKNKMITAGVIFLLFFISLVIRSPNFNRPLGNDHEWLTSHTLRIQQIWYEDGAWKHWFNPITSFNGQANKNIIDADTNYQMTDKNGDIYHVSYPPFAYIFPFLFFKLFNIYPNVIPLLIFSLILNFFSAFFVFLIIKKLTQKFYQNKLNYPALFGFALYLFFPTTLWFQSNVFMADMMVQPLFIVGVYLFTKITTGEKEKKSLYWLLGLINFFMIYTEWLGIFFAFSVFIYCLFNYKKDGSKQMLISIITSTFFSLTLFIWQFSQIDGLKNLLQTLSNKYLIRSGLSNEKAESDLNYLNPVSWDYLIAKFAWGYLAEIIIALISALFYLKNKLKDKKWISFNRPEKITIYIALLPAVLHHLIFFNFTVIHSFSLLKDAVFIALIVALFYHYLTITSFIKNRQKKILKLGTGLAIVLPVILLITGLNGLSDIIPQANNLNFKTLGQQISQTAKNDEVVFIKDNTDDLVEPQLIFYAHRNIAKWQDETSARNLLEKNQINTGIIFVLNENQEEIIGVEYLRK